MTFSFRVFVILVVIFIATMIAGVATQPAEKPSPPEERLPFEKVVKEEPAEETAEPEVATQGANDETSEEGTTITEAVGNVVKTLTAPAPIPVSPTTLNEQVRNTLVNILCTPETGGVVSSITGSGVFVDARGVILTNAHVGQYFLLEDYPRPDFLSCIVRAGSPARPAYTAELLYLPPSWIQKNAEKIDDEKPTGNGEHDYALLYVTGVIGQNKEVPTVFPYLPLLFTEVSEDDEVLVAGYPAGFLGGISITKELHAASSPTRIGELYTYETSTVDIFSVGGSIVAQQGSSGGAVVDTTGNLVGLIVTSTIAPETSSRDLHAVSSSYIARDFEKEAGVSLPTFFSGDLADETARFLDQRIAFRSLGR